MQQYPGATSPLNPAVPNSNLLLGFKIYFNFANSFLSTSSYTFAFDFTSGSILIQFSTNGN